MAAAEQSCEEAEPPSIYLLSAFVAMEPVDALISLAKECGDGLISEHVQRFICDHCIFPAGERSHQPYLQNFLKKVIREVESAGGVVLDEIYQQYAEYMASSKDGTLFKGDLWIVKCISFLFHGGPGCSSRKRLIIPLRCSLNMLGGDTGCSVWPSGLFLSEFILSFPGIFASRSCFEVGSGVGLVGICLYHAKAPKVVMSDGDLSTLANLKLNLAMNHISEMDTYPDEAKKDASQVKCIHLPWNSAKESQLQVLAPDIILGADVIYDPSCLPHLVRLLSILLKQRKGYDKTNPGLFPLLGTCLNKEKRVGSSDVNISAGSTSSSNDQSSDSAYFVESVSRALDFGPLAFIATVIRNIDTFNCFLTLASEACLTVTDLTDSIKPVNLLPYMKSYNRSDDLHYSCYLSVISPRWMIEVAGSGALLTGTKRLQ